MSRISRREFGQRVGVAAAATVVASAAGVPGVVRAQSARPNARVMGANDRVVLASIGIRGQGNALKRGFARVPNAEIKTLCDIDANLAPERINDTRLADVTTFKPNFVQDLRRVLDDKDVDAVIIATPNHWHALATIWALQAGKHVFVEKPVSHTVWEGRQQVQAATYYKRVVQSGFMNRSRKVVREAVDFMRGGGIGKVYLSRGLCFKPRPAIGKYPDGPMAPGEKYSLTAGGTTFEPTYDETYLSKVDYDLWTGPAPKRPFNRNRFHYNWHWHWAYGDGDTGNQGPHQFDVARWGLGQTQHPVKITSAGGYYGAPASQETPDTLTSLFTYADGTVLEFATRGEFSNDEGTQRIGNLFYGDKGWLWIDGDGRKWQSYLGSKNEKGPGADITAQPPANPLVSFELPHYQNFVDAVRANDSSKLNSHILEGHMSSALPHLANVAYRIGRALTFDGKTETCVNDADANKLLTREYRKGFELPKVTV